MSLKAVKRIGLIYKDKENLYLLVKVEIKGRKIIISFNILLLSKDKVVLGILFLKEFNLKIN